MYCPKCAAENTENVKYCRVCGANLSLVPQALTGSLPSRRSTRKHDRKEQQPPNLQGGVTQAFMGVGFMAVAAVLLFVLRQDWGVWMLIPAFVMFGKGAAEIVAVRNEQALSALRTPAQVKPAANTNELPPADFSNPPPSVTETTTRQLDAPVRYPGERQ